MNPESLALQSQLVATVFWLDNLADKYYNGFSKKFSYVVLGEAV
jgi:hypothetical protein